MTTTLIIAEIGTSHGGDLDRARDLIAAAHEAGADAAKFQYVIADEIVHPAMTPINLPGGSTRLYDRFVELERDPEFYARIAESCESEGIRFLCTAFGEESARRLHEIGLRRFKVASPEINHTPLLSLLSNLEVDMILSTGVSMLSDIERALTITGRDGVELLHCITSYPAPEEQYNLRLITSLRNVFGVPVGLSDHSLHPRLVPGLAATLGASAVEKHFTLSREGTGLDDPIAIEPREFAMMVETIRRAESDAPAVATELRQEFGSARVEKILGDGVKRLAAAEADNYRTTRRSLLARKELSPGHVITEEDVAPLRSESLPPGLDPSRLHEIIGRRLSRGVEAGHGISWADLTSR